MTKTTNIFYAVFFLFFACKSNAQNKDYYLNWSVTITEDSILQKEAINTWIMYLKTKDNGDDTNCYWNINDRTKYGKETDYYLKDIGNSYYNGKQYYKPTILYLEKIADSTFIIKTAFAHAEPNGFTKLADIVDIMIIPEKGRLRLKSMLEYNLKKNNYVTVVVGNITYCHREDYNINIKLAQKFDSLNNALSKLFDVEKAITFDYFLCKDSKELDNLRGFSFNYRVLNPQNGGLAYYSKKPTVYSENNNEYFPHELIHLYVGKKFGDRYNNFFNEGVASLIGDCGYKANMPFDFHLKRIANYIKNNREYNFSDFENLKSIDNITNMTYFTGALLCKIIYEKDGIKGLFKLLSTDPDAYITLEQVLNLKKENIDTYIKTELKKHE
jgi:hypothetical protein